MDIWGNGCLNWDRWALEKMGIGSNGHLRKMGTRKNGLKGKWALGPNKHQGKIRANRYFLDKLACWELGQMDIWGNGHFGTNGHWSKWVLGAMGTWKKWAPAKMYTRASGHLGK